MELESFRQGYLRKSVSLLTVMIFTFVLYISPNSKVIADSITKEQNRQAEMIEVLEKTTEQKLSRRLESLQKSVVEQDMLGDQSGILTTLQFWKDDDPLGPDQREQLTALSIDLKELKIKALEDLSKVEKHLRDNNLPAVVITRQLESAQQLTEQLTDTQLQLTELLNTKDLEKAELLWESLKGKLKDQQFKPSHSPYDPNTMPFGTPSKDIRSPSITSTGLQSALGIQAKAILVASSDSLSGLSEQALRELRAGDLPQSDLYLAETPDIQINKAMRDLANQLNNNPTEIYTWVHNNIFFIPSHGSIQGAAMTLDLKKGNATDTASLLIGLLRAAGIPARYAYGTVDLPADKVMNWVGGVDNVSSAQGLLGQGGIPNTGLISAGQIKSVRLEHTWVEAYVDFEPSRGVKNRKGDYWIPMDASFKQYEFSEGMDLEQQVPFDAEGLLADIESSATVNEQEGWVQGVSGEKVKEALGNYQQQLSDYIENQNPDATIGEVLGLQQVTIKAPEPLAVGLPYFLISTQERFAEVPNKLRHKFKYQLQTQYYGQPGSTLFTFVQPTVALAGKQLALSFKPSTENDAAIIESYLPTVENGGVDPDTGEVDPAALPNTLPGYLIQMTAEFSVDGNTQHSIDAGKMGTELYSTLGVYSPSHGWSLANNHPIIGEYRAIGLDLQGGSSEQASELEQRMKVTQQILQDSQNAELATLTKRELVGDLLYSTIFSYLTLNGIQDQLQAKSSQVIVNRMPSFGIFGTKITPHYWFGTPRNVSFSGLQMDVDHLAVQVNAKDNSSQERIQFMQASGSRASAMEHLVPEQMFSTAENKAEGVSTMKALALASAEGQKIWTIDRNNVQLALESINLDPDTESEIRNSVNAGMLVTAHERPINFNGWIGEGYMIIDSATGAGAYKISGGGNGGVILTDPVGLTSLILTLWSVVKGVFAIGADFLLNMFNTMIKCSIAAASSGSLLVGLAIIAAVALMTFMLLTVAVYAFIIASQVGGLAAVIATIFGAGANYYGWGSLNDSCDNINGNN